MLLSTRGLPPTIFVLFCSILHKMSCDLKMAQFKGKVTIGGGLDEVKNSDLQSCTALCYLSSECLVAQIDNAQTCTLFKPEKVRITVNADRTEGNIVIFKLTMTSSCPSSSANVSFVYSSSSYSYNYTWNATGSQWILQGCRDTWKQFNRDDGVIVCMKVFAPVSVTRQVAVDNCKNIGTVLTGVDSLEESRWIHDHIKQNELTGDYTGFWIDGIRTCPNNVACKNFIWTDGYTTGNASLVETNAFLANVSPNNANGEHCLSVGNMPNLQGQTINDVFCDYITCAGYVCGYKLQ